MTVSSLESGCARVECYVTMRSSDCGGNVGVAGEWQCKSGTLYDPEEGDDHNLLAEEWLCFCRSIRCDVTTIEGDGFVMVQISRG